jgi:hypothetical protein
MMRQNNKCPYFLKLLNLAVIVKNDTAIKMTIIKTTLPTNSKLYTIHKKYDYVDSFQGVLNDDKNEFTSVDICRLPFFSTHQK